LWTRQKQRDRRNTEGSVLCRFPASIKDKKPGNPVGFFMECRWDVLSAKG
jgi:hypothetical protein